MVDHVAPAALQLRGHPDRDQPLPDVGRGGPRDRQPPPRPWRRTARAWPREPRHHRAGRGLGRDSQLPVTFDLAAGLGADAGRDLRDAGAGSLLDRCRVPRRRRAVLDRLALEGGAGVTPSPHQPPPQPHPQVTRSTAAFSAAAAGRVARQRVAQPSGWWGMALFLCAEVTLFGTLIATYFYLDFEAHRWPPAGIKAPSVVLPFIATGVLVFLSAPMWLAA